MLYIMLAGGKSKRLGLNKLLISVCGLPLVWVSFIKYKSLGLDLKVAASKRTLNEVIFLKFLGAEIIETPGKGYSEDVGYLLKLYDEPIFLFSADSIYLKKEHIKYFLSKADNQSMSAAVKCCNKIVYVGMNYAVPGSQKDKIIFLNDKKLSYSINVIEDLEVFKKWLWKNGCYSLFR
ncbi:MAG: NTP transferase domain-containing protein [Nitrososphaeria archaeon]